MSWHEYVGNTHVHTKYSDGAARHADVALAAQMAGLDFIIFTDHNLWLSGIEGYFGSEADGHVLLLSGEEVHDRKRNPGCNHLLVYGAEQEMVSSAHNLSTLVENIASAGGLSFIAHPDDNEVDWFGEPALSWQDRYVEGFTGLEIWNYMSRFKDYIQVRNVAVKAVFRPEDVVTGPSPDTLALWDELLSTGLHVAGIGGADAHGTRIDFGPLSHVVFPYDYLFNCVNTHIITRYPLNGSLEHDKALVYQSLQIGRAFIGYDLIGDTRGFRYTAQGQGSSATMGEHIRLGPGVTLQVIAPMRGHVRIVCAGETIAEDYNVENLTLVVRESGAYRAEVWCEFRGEDRAWILSNPIYVDPNPGTRLRR